MRKAGDRLRIGAQLIDAASDTHVWSEKYNRTMEDVFDIQERVARAIADALRVKLTPEESREIARRPIEDAGVYEWYLRARGGLLGMILGTAAYIPPAQAKGRVVDRRADVCVLRNSWRKACPMVPRAAKRFDSSGIWKTRGDTAAIMARKKAGMRWNLLAGANRLTGAAPDGGTCDDDQGSEAQMTSQRLAIGLAALNLAFLAFIVGREVRLSTAVAATAPEAQSSALPHQRGAGRWC